MSINYKFYKSEYDRILNSPEHEEFYKIKLYHGDDLPFDYYVVLENYEVMAPEGPYGMLMMQEVCHRYRCNAIINFQIREIYEGDDIFKVYSGTFVETKDPQENMDFGDYSDEEVGKILSGIKLWTMERVPFSYEVVDSEPWVSTESKFKGKAIRQIEFMLKEMFYQSDVTDIINVQYHINIIKRYSEVPRFSVFATGIAVKRTEKPQFENNISDEEF